MTMTTTMMISRIIISIAWLINIVCLIIFLYDSWKQESCRKAALSVLLLISAGMLYMEYGIVLRDGCDEHIVMNLISCSLFEEKYIKEYALLPIYNMFFYLTGNSLNAILICNKAFPFLSIFVFFAILRRFGISITVSSAAAAVMFLNFNMMISASSMYPGSCIIFLSLCSIAASSFAFIKSNSDKIRLRFYLLWFFSVLALIISFRAEIAPIPASLFLLSFYLLFKEKKLRLSDLKITDYAILLIGVSVCTICSVEGIKCLSAGLIQSHFELYRRIIYNLIAYNFSVLFDNRLYIADDEDFYMRLPMQLMFISLSAFIAAGIYKFIIRRNKTNIDNILISFIFIILLLYITYISGIRDFFYLQYVRLNIVCFMIFSFVFAFAAEGYRSIFNRKKKSFALFVSLFMFCYFCINAKTAFALNTELRTSDHIWQIFLSAQKELKGKYRISSLDINYEWFITKFFHSADNKALNDIDITFISPELYVTHNINKNLLTPTVFTMSGIYKPFGYRDIPEIPVSFGFYNLEKNYEFEKHLINFNEKNINFFINDLEKEIKEREDDRVRIAFLILALAASGQEDKAKQTLKRYKNVFCGYGVNYILKSKNYRVMNNLPSAIDDIMMNNLSLAIDNISNDKYKFIYRVILAREAGRPADLLKLIISVYQNPLLPYPEEQNDVSKVAAK